MNIVQQLLQARERVEDLESELIGLEINYMDHDYCIVESVEGDFVSLYIEDGDINMPEVTNQGISLEELQKYL